MVFLPSIIRQQLMAAFSHYNYTINHGFILDLQKVTETGALECGREMVVLTQSVIPPQERTIGNIKTPWDFPGLAVTGKLDYSFRTRFDCIYPSVLNHIDISITDSSFLYKALLSLRYLYLFKMDIGHI